MSLTLSSAEQNQLAGVTRTLLNPLAFDSADAWRAEVMTRAKQLLRADVATFQLPTASSGILQTDVDNQFANREFSGLVDPIHRQFGLWENQLRQGAWSRRTVWGEHGAALQRSAYYAQFVLPLRLYDAVGLTVPSRVHPNATLYFHHESPRGPRFGRRGIALLRLLRDAFAAGVALHETLGSQRSALVRVLDEVAEPMLLFDESQRLLHANRAAREQVMADPASLVRQECQAVARSVLLSIRPLHAAADARVSREINAGAATYRLTGTLIDSGLLSSARTILVRVQSASVRMPSAQHLEERFGLTPREAVVAVQLARGLSLDDIASVLRLSRHTVRHHTESIMRKMNVRSRAELAPAVLGLEPL